MRVTIEGTTEQVADALGIGSPVEVRPRRVGEAKRRNQAAVERRRLLRQAFDLIRDDPDEQQMANDLARALGCREQVTTELLESAQRIVSQRGKGKIDRSAPHS